MPWRQETAGEGMRLVTDGMVTAVGADNAVHHDFHAGGWDVLHATAPAEVWEALPLRCLAEGLTAAAVGRRLASSARTVHTHVEHVHRTLRVGDRVSGLDAAARLGLLSPLVPVARDRCPMALSRALVPSSPFLAPQS